MKRDAGFTLLEVLIAMTILAIAAGGLLAASGNSLRQMQVLENKTQAAWIAENTLSEMRASRRWPELGVTTSNVTVAERNWEVRVNVTQTAQEDMRQLVVEVFEGNAEVAVMSLTGFLGRH